MRNIRVVVVAAAVAGIVAGGVAQVKPNMSKLDYYNTVLAPQDGKQPIQKTSGIDDQKRSVMDVGNVWAMISNNAVLGYSRWGSCWEFPAKSGFTYRWTMGPLVGAMKKRPDGSGSDPIVAVGTRGAFRYSEEEYQPLPGFDAGVMDEAKNIGIAMSDKPESWPSSWPALGELPAYARQTIYNQPPIGSTGFPGVKNGEVVATREAYFVITDNDPVNGNNPRPLDIRTDMWALQWDNFVNRNFIIFRMLVTNVGTDTLENVYIGVHDDPDCPEEGNNEWTDDFAAFIPVGTDVPEYSNAEDSLLANFTYLWDGDDRAEGLISSNVGWVGLKFMETPIDPATGKPKGITTFQVFEYSSVTRTEATEYAQLEAGVMSPPNVAPHPADWTQSPNTYGPDVTYVVASGPFRLAPGESLPFTFASVHGANKSELFNNAMLCQLLYNKEYSSPMPPPEPYVRASVGDRKVTLSWDDRSEKGIYYKTTAGPDGRPQDSVLFVNDPITGNNAFEGYQIFRSTDRGKSWGTQTITDIKGSTQYYVPLAQYDLPDGIVGESSKRRFFPLGQDVGLRHMYVDNNVFNGYEYWYAVLAYDREDGPLPPLENPIGRNPDTSPFDHVVRVVPQAPAAGARGASIQNGGVAHTAGVSAYAPEVSIVNPTQVKSRSYTIAVEEDANGQACFTVRDEQNQLVVSANGRDTVRAWPVYDSATDNAVIFDGVRCELSDGWPTYTDFEQPVGEGLGLDYLYSYPDFEGSIVQGTRVSLSSDYEMRFVATPQIYPDYSRSSTTAGVGVQANFEVWNITSNQRVTCFVAGGSDWYGNDDGVWNVDEFLFLVDSPYTGDSVLVDVPYVYFLGFAAGSTYAPGDVFRVTSERVLTQDDRFTFSTIAPSTATITESDLAQVTAVPNPFVVSSYYETLKFGISKELQFHQLPPRCTIRIYNIAGDYIQSIVHDDPTSSVARWNLQTYNGQELAFGVYFFHVDAPGIGESIGKFAILK